MVETTIAARPSYTWADVEPVAARFGRFSLLKMLPSERDQNFLVTGYEGQSEAAPVAEGATEEAPRFVLKVNNPSDELAFIECQDDALERAAAAGARCQRLLRATADAEGGEARLLVPLPAGDAGRTCWCRMLTYLPGKVLAEVAPTCSNLRGLWTACGRAVGSVSAALLPMRHTAAQRAFVWDLQRCVEVIGRHQPLVARPERRALIERLVAEYRRTVEPLVPRLRTSVAHNDPNDHNLVVLDDGAVGVLDFGDMLHTYACADAAICMAYLLFHCPQGQSLAESVVPFVAAFHAQCPLHREEVQALFGLAVMRVCTSVCLSAHQSSFEPDNEYLTISAAPGWALLERLAATWDAAGGGGGFESEAAVLCAACGFGSAGAPPVEGSAPDGG